MFSGLLGEEVHDNIFWPDLPYITDENGSKFIDFMSMLLVPWVAWYYIVVLRDCLCLSIRYLLSGQE